VRSVIDPPPPRAQKGLSNRPFTSTGTSMPRVAGTWAGTAAPTPAGISWRVASSCATTAGSAFGRWNVAALGAAADAGNPGRGERCGCQQFYDQGMGHPAEVAVDTTAERLPGIDRSAMQMVLLLHRVASSIVYDLESTVHRPAGWSWSAFRLLFTLWVAGPHESRQVAHLSGMSRAAVSSLTKTLSASGLLARRSDERDRRAVILSLTERGADALETTFRAHNEREARWASLITEDELATLNGVLTKLARAAQGQEWISRRS
jgi:DNA-binding MarR family transcriptional regulator